MQRRYGDSTRVTGYPEVMPLGLVPRNALVSIESLLFTDWPELVLRSQFAGGWHWLTIGADDGQAGGNGGKADSRRSFRIS